ncbi:MAG: TonB-dependent receptor [Verrucomicrobiota bacterium]
MSQEVLTTSEKALQVNLDNAKYGTFAEIGAGQETARWFFRVGGAAGTIAKSMSAYDMKFSDEIYGVSERYVSRKRLHKMLDHEYELIMQRLSGERGETSQFFAFADTVSARNFRGTNECHGWVGIRYQLGPMQDSNDIIIHVRMLDDTNLEQQEALGIVGVNLVHSAFYLHHEPESFVRSLCQNVSKGRIEVDMVKFSGPSFGHIDNRVLALYLVKHGLTEATMFAPDGEVLQPAEMLYKRPILVERGRFRPVTKLNIEMLESAHFQFFQEDGKTEQKEELVEIMEITMNNLMTKGEGGLDLKDFIARVEILGALGKSVVISNYAEFHRLASYLSRASKEKIGIVLGVPLLKEIFKEKYYEDLAGGILESFGRLFRNQVRLYVYPARNPKNEQIITAHNLEVEPHLQHLHRYLIENRFIEPIRSENPAMVNFSSSNVIKKINLGDASWQQLVSPRVAKIIKERGFFGLK